MVVEVEHDGRPWLTAECCPQCADDTRWRLQAEADADLVPYEVSISGPDRHMELGLMSRPKQEE
jgi:hypothetical protein